MRRAATTTRPRDGCLSYAALQGSGLETLSLARTAVGRDGVLAALSVPSLTSLDLSGTGVTSIGDHAFRYCSLLFSCARAFARSRTRASYSRGGGGHSVAALTP